MSNIKVDNLEPIDIDRPDVVKTGYKKSLTFKEVKDYFIKFLLQAGIPFTDGERLTITSTLLVKNNKSEVEESIEINNTSCYYTAICRLVNITVNLKPIYIVLLPDDYYSIEIRQRNKLIALKQVYNLLIFDSSDWDSIGLDISGKEWLKALTKPTLRKLVILLFKKINQLGGEVKSKYTLPEIYGNIEASAADQRSKSYIVASLKKENLNLKKELFSRILDIDLNSGSKLLEYLAYQSEDTLARVSDSLSYVIQSINKVDFRCKVYRDFFKSKSKYGLFINSNKVAEFIKQELSRKYNLDIELHDTLLVVYNKKTYQTLYINVVCNNRRDKSKILIDGDKVGYVKNSLVCTYVLNTSKHAPTSKINNVQLYLQLVDSGHRNIGHCVYDSKINKNFALRLGGGASGKV